MSDYKIKAQKTRGVTLEVEVPKSMTTLDAKIEFLTAACTSTLYGPGTRSELKLDQSDTDVLVTIKFEGKILE